jgi:DNA-binding response OmpR family regulator
MKTILLVEDDKFLLKLFAYKLRKLGYNIILLEDGVNVVKTVGEKKPDLIILDIILPKKNGFDVLLELREKKYIKSIPVIVVSQLGLKSDIDKAMELGATQYLVKSEVMFKDVVRAVEDKLRE